MGPSVTASSAGAGDTPAPAQPGPFPFLNSLEVAVFLGPADESVRGQPLAVVALLGADFAGPFGGDVPSGEIAVGCCDLAGGERVGDASPDLGFIAGVGGEEHPQPDDAAVALGGSVVRRERAGRRVLPAPAEGDGDRPSRSLGILVALHGQDRIVGEDGAHRGDGTRSAAAGVHGAADEVAHEVDARRLVADEGEDDARPVFVHCPHRERE